MAILFMFSLFLLVRGHNLPGGGFTGGLVAASAFVLQALAYGHKNAAALIPCSPQLIIGSGLLVAVLSALLSTTQGLPFMTGVWGETAYPVIGQLGTPFFFDLGVYLVVFGVIILIAFSLADTKAFEKLSDPSSEKINNTKDTTPSPAPHTEPPIT